MTETGVQPIFVIGAPRSGTTVFFDLFTSANEFGLFTNYDDLLVRTPFMGIVRRMFVDVLRQRLGQRLDYGRPYDFSSFRPRKTEAYRFWSRYAGHEFLRSYLWTRRPSTSTALGVSSKINRLCKFQARSTFAAKLTGPGRISYLRHIFPRAKFIHVVRDCRPQVYSLLNVGFWKCGGGLERLWWNRDLPKFVTEHVKAAEATCDPVALAASQWRAVVDSTREEARLVLRRDEYREVSYETFVTDPVHSIMPLWEWAGIRKDAAGTERVSRYQVHANANMKWRRNLSSEDQATITRWAEGPLLGA